MSSDAKQQFDIASAFEWIGKMSAVVASFGLIVSVLYDWGFLFALNLSFADAPTTISDHVRSWLVWLPKIATVIPFFLAFELLTRRIEHGMTEDEINKSSPNPERTEKFRKSPVYAIGWVGVVALILWVLLGGVFADGAFLGLIVIWLLFTRWVFNHPVVRERHSAPFRFFVRWGTLVMVSLFFFGFTSARSASSSALLPHRLHMSGGVEEAHILRSFEKWLLIQDKAKKILWVRSDEVRRIEGPAAEPPFRGLVCLLSDKLCLPPESEKTK